MTQRAPAYSSTENRARNVESAGAAPRRVGVSAPLSMTTASLDPSNPWKDIATFLRAAMSDEDFRRWFAAAAYASDSGDQITVWVPSESVRRHIQLHFRTLLDEALDAINRSGAQVRFLVAGVEEDEEDG
jgi:hypothetical protein